MTDFLLLAFIFLVAGVVSVPIATDVKLAATATAEPLDEPHGLRAGSYGLRV